MGCIGARGGTWAPAAEVARSAVSGRTVRIIGAC
jgi:hypothetical protein